MYINEEILLCSEYRPTVLIAQCDKNDLDFIREQSIIYDKYDTIYVSTGQEIIDAVNITCFDAIILGLKFPDITGATIAYLVHQFDPLVTLGFLTNYSSSILIAAVEDLNCKFWNKNEKFKYPEQLCEDIYNLAIEMPCDNDKRVIKREFMKPEREKYIKYSKLIIPSSIAEVVKKYEVAGVING